MDSEFQENLEKFHRYFDWMVDYIHEWAIRKGFWAIDHERNTGEIIALMHSELSEALEAMRQGNMPDDKIPEFDSYTAELADCIIRIMDAAGSRNVSLGGAIVSKMMYNEGRPYKHDKAF